MPAPRPWVMATSIALALGLSSLARAEQVCEARGLDTAGEGIVPAGLGAPGASTQPGSGGPQPPASPPGLREVSGISILIGYGPTTSSWFKKLYGFTYSGLPGLGSSATGDADMGGLAVSFRYLQATGLLGSRLRLGGEVGLFTVMAGGSGGPVNNTCYVGPGGSSCYTETDDAGIHVSALASLRLLSAGRLTLRVEGGAGLVFFNLNDAGPAKKKNGHITFMTGAPYFTSAPGVEPVVLVRLVPAISLVRAESGVGVITLDPYVSLLQTLGTTKTTAVTFGLGLGIQLGEGLRQ